MSQKNKKKKDPQNYLWAAWDLDFRSSLAIVWSENQGTGITQELTKNAEFQSHPRPNESEPESESLGHLSAYQRLRHPGLIHLLIKRAARWEYLRSFKKYWCLFPILRDSVLMSLEYSLGTFFQSCPRDFTI